MDGVYHARHIVVNDPLVGLAACALHHHIEDGGVGAFDLDL